MLITSILQLWHSHLFLQKSQNVCLCFSSLSNEIAYDFEKNCILQFFFFNISFTSDDILWIFGGILKFNRNTMLNFWNIVSVISLFVLATFSAFDSAWFFFPELSHLIWTINKIIAQIFFQRITTTLVCYLYVGVVLRQFIFSLLQDFSGVLNSTNFQSASAVILSQTEFYNLSTWIWLHFYYPNS